MLLLCLNLFAQEDSKAKVLSGGVYFAPNICYRLISNVDDYYEWFTDNRNLYEKPAFYFSSGINLNLDINNVYGFETGLSYIQGGYAYKKMELINNEYSHISNNVKYSFLELPIGFRYYISRQKAKLYTSLGISLNTYLSSSIVYHYYDVNKLMRNEIYRNIIDVHQFSLSSYWGLGVRYSINDNFYFYVQSLFTQNITSVINTDIKEYLSRGSLKLGLSKNF